MAGVTGSCGDIERGHNVVTMVGFVSADLSSTCTGAPPVFRDSSQRAIVWAHPVSTVLVASLSSGCIVSAADLRKAGAGVSATISSKQRPCNPRSALLPCFPSEAERIEPIPKIARRFDLSCAPQPGFAHSGAHAGFD